jgi:hypothetical protein
MSTKRPTPAPKSAAKTHKEPSAARAPSKKPAGGTGHETGERAEAVTALVKEASRVSAADRARAESLLAEIARRKQRIAEDFYDIGLALLQLFKKKLHVALGYRSFKEMLTAREVLSPTTAKSLIRLVSTISREQALEYGQEKAIVLLSYSEATPELDTPKTLMDSGQLPGGKPVAAASVRDLKEATKQIRAAQGKSKALSEEARAARAEVKTVVKWLHSHGVSKPEVREIRAEGGYRIRVDLPLASWAKLRSR